MQLVLGSIDWQGQVIDPQPVAVGIRVGESPGLQYLVIGQVDACKGMSTKKSSKQNKLNPVNECQRMYFRFSTWALSIINLPISSRPDRGPSL